MKPAPFSYRRPETVDDALAALREHGSDASVLAGGQSLVPVLSLRVARPSVIVDINRIPGLSTIAVDDGAVEIGALARQHEALDSAEIREHAGLLGEGLQFVGCPETRNRGTVVGSLAHNDPAAEVPAIALALDGEVVLRSAAGERVVPVHEYLIAPYLTARAPEELVTALRLERLGPGAGFAFEEIARRHHDFALVAAAAVVELASDGTVADVRLALSGVAGTARRYPDAEDVLRGSPADASVIEEAAARAAAECDPPGDVLASSAYRRHLAGVLSRRALTRATERARGTA